MVSEKYNYCNVVGRTDVGCVRKANEDNLGAKETVNGLVALVCDGMGGHVGGATASQIAVDTILEFLDAQYYDNPQQAIGMAIDAANNAVLARTEIQPELRGMGSTCVLLIVRDGKVYIGSVGDSRVYLVRNHIAKQLTKDQSYVQMLVDMGQITEDQAEHHPRKNEITNAIGIVGMKPATVLPDAILPEAGDCFLLCSDGLSGMVTKHEIEKIVCRQAEMRTQERADMLVEKAKQHGGLDNVTVQLVEFSVSPNASKKGPDKDKIKKIAGICAAALLVIAGVCAALFVDFKKDKDKETIVQFDNAVQFVNDGVLMRITVDDLGTTTFIVGSESKPIPSKIDLENDVDFGDQKFSRKINGDTLFLMFTTDPVDKAEIIVRCNNNLYKLMIPVSSGKKESTSIINIDGNSISLRNSGGNNQGGKSRGSQGKTSQDPPVNTEKGTKDTIQKQYEFQTVTDENTELMRLEFKEQSDGSVALAIKFPGKDTFEDSTVSSFDIESFKCDSCKFERNNDMIVIYHPVRIEGEFSFTFSFEDEKMIYPYKVTLNYTKEATIDPKEQNRQMEIGDSIELQIVNEGVKLDGETLLTSFDTIICPDGFFSLEERKSETGDTVIKKYTLDKDLDAEVNMNIFGKNNDSVIIKISKKEE